MDEPKNRLPLPSPQPSRELLDGSWGLDLTPERHLKPRESIRNSKPRTSGDTSKTIIGGPLINAPAPAVSVLSAPQLNSTVPLSNKIHQLREQKNGLPESETPATISSRKPPTSAQLSSIKENVEDLEEMLRSKPLKEVNIPRHTSRYSDLVPVEISKESFQKLIKKPRVLHVPGGKSTQEVKNTSDEPSIMDFFSSDLEWEEAEWSVTANNYHDRKDSAVQQLDSLDVPRYSSFTLYSHLRHTWY